MIDLDYVIHALVFTVVAGYIAYVYLKSKYGAQPEEETKIIKRQVGYEGIIPPSRGMPMGVHLDEPAVAPAVVEEEKHVPEPEVVPEEVAAAPVVVEEIAVVEKKHHHEHKEPEHVQPEVVPEPVVVAEPVVVPEPEPVVLVPEHVEEPIPVLIAPEPLPEIVPEHHEPMPEEHVPEPAVVEKPLTPEPEPLKEEAPVYVAEYASEHIHEPEPYNYNAATDFTPGKKQSKFETLMTKEEMEDEQRSSEY